MFLKWILVALFLISYSEVAFASQILKAIWGVPAMELTIIPDMYTLHLPGPRTARHYNDNNNPMFAVSYKGFFAGTFVNSFRKRTYAIGVQRYWFERHPTPNLVLQLGYRLGIMYGYQNTSLMSGVPGLSWVNKNSPIFPAAEVIFDATYRHIGLELSWIDVAATASLYIRF